MPFSHLTVVDLATLGAAPQIAAFFGDFGARVIKVEQPRGDGLRQLVDRRGVALQWQIINRNKHCVTLDVAKPAGREVLRRLLERTDVLVSNLSARRLGRWRLEREELARRHPRLVTVNLTAYGLSGPWCERQGSGTLAEAAGGLAALTGERLGPPTLSPVGLGDHLGALQGIIAALIGLYARDHGGAAPDGGSPGFFDLALYQPLLALLSHRIATAARDGEEPGRHGNRFPNVAPRNTYRAADDAWVALTAGTDDIARRLFAAIGRAELADDARFRDNLARLAHVDELDAVLGAWIGRRSADEAVETLAPAGVSVARCDGLLRVAANPHFRARHDLADLAAADGAALTLAQPLPPGRIRWLGRSLGADNEDIFVDWLGLAAGELARLRRAGVV
jgi:crotonobetainyl-CoA:carnitine CoA-transferase CaiB-like acyl-CoA transferase